MATGAKYVVSYRRKREQKTDYRRRLDLLKSGLTRLIVRPSNKNITLQLVVYESNGDKIIGHAFSKELSGYGWSHSTSNLPAAYLTGLVLAKKVEGKVSGEIILDSGFHSSNKGSRIYAAVKGVIDGGLKVRVGDGVFPDESRIKGEHISSHVERSKNITKDFEKARDSILSSKGKKND
ncbi:50S ribosomal protein L18 [Candidatus Altiarchaeota archaeon]